MSIKENITFKFYKIYLKYNNPNSIKAKITKDLIKGLILSFILGYSIFIFYFYEINQHEAGELLLYSGVYLISLIFIFTIVDYILFQSLKKNILDRFDSIKKELNNIKEGDLTKRITLQGSDEIDKMTYFTNTLLDELEKFVEYEKKYSLIDPLTECYNRRALEINIKTVISRAKRNKESFSIVILDLDHFKKVNDEYGHSKGDQVLIKFSKILKEIVREHDFVCRIGGEEFLIVLNNINKLNTKKILERFRKNITYQLKKAIPEITREITTSGGFVSSRKYNLDDKDILKNMVDDADKLLYEAKNKGRNRIHG